VCFHAIPSLPDLFPGSSSSCLHRCPLQKASIVAAATAAWEQAEAPLPCTMIAARYVFYSIIPPLFLAPSFCLLSPLALLSNPLLLPLPCKHSSSQRALKKRPVSLLRPDGFLLLLYTALASVKTRLKGEPRRPSSPCQRAALNCSSEQRPVCLIFIARLPSLRPPAKREEVACECPPPVWSPPPPPVGRSVGRFQQVVLAAFAAGKRDRLRALAIQDKQSLIETAVAGRTNGEPGSHAFTIAFRPGRAGGLVYFGCNAMYLGVTHGEFNTESRIMEGLCGECTSANI
jgi:hypothetical protein